MEAIRKVVVAPKEVSDAYLVEAYENQKIQDTHYMTKEDLFKKVFFSLHPLALYKASAYLKLKPEIVKPWLEFLYYVDETTPSTHKAIERLKALKAYLIEEGMLEFFKQTAHFFKGVSVTVIGYQVEGVLKLALDKLKSYAAIDVFEAKKVNQEVYVDAFHTREEEVFQTLRLMREMHETGVAYQTMTLLPVDSESRRLFLHYAQSFGVVIDFQQKRPLISFLPVQRFLKAFKQSNETTLIKRFNEALDTARVNQGKIRSSLVDVLNTFLSKPLEVSFGRYLENALKAKTVSFSKRKNGVTLGTYESVGNADSVLFIMNAEEGRFPVFKADDDLLNDHVKKTLEIPTSKEVNASKEASIIALMHRFKRVYISYALSSKGETLYQAELLNKIKKQFDVKQRTARNIKTQPFSEILDKVLTKQAFDAYQLYGTRHEYLSLVEMFNDTLAPYDNRFKGISSETLRMFYPKLTKFSYTRLNTAFQCDFRYYTEHLLTLDLQESTLSLDFGNFFHYVFETYLKEETELTYEALEQVLDDFCKNKDYGKKALFYLKNSLGVLLDVFNFTKAHQEESAFKVSHIELDVRKVYDLKVPVELVGKIDKVMQEDQHTVLIDYKTGSPTLSLAKTVNKMPSQLLVYALLIKETIEEAIDLVGVYEQAVFPKPLSKDAKKTKAEVLRDYVKLDGLTLEDEALYKRFDPSSKNDAFVKGVKLKKDGTFNAQAKTYKQEVLEVLLKNVDAMIEEKLKALLEGDFSVNPKVINDKNVSCKYCSMRDVCFKTYEDHVRLSASKDADVLKALGDEIDGD